MVNFKINRLPNQHIVDRYLETVEPLGVINDNQGLDFFLSEDLLNFQNLVNLKKLPQAYIALPIGAGRNTKALTIEKIVSICQSINYPIVLLGGKQEIEKAEQIEKLLGVGEVPPPDPLQRGSASYLNEKSKDFDEFGVEDEDKIGGQLINLVGKCSLLESAAIVKNAAVVLTGDTGLMHIAAAFQKPIVSIWGNTVPEFGMYPYYPKGMDLNRSIEVKDLSCRPCSKIGYEDCPKGHFKCITKLSVIEIIAQLREFIAIQE